MPTVTPDAIIQRAAALSPDGDQAAAEEQMIELVGSDRQALGEARDQVAAHLHRHIDDYRATATLRLLNRTLARVPIQDPLDWRTRWARHRKP